MQRLLQKAKPTIAKIYTTRKCYISNLIRRPIIGILGGVGPMAGTIAHKTIIDSCIVSMDQDHLDVIHLSCPQYIADRTAYLMELKQIGKTNLPNPGTGMARVAKSLSTASFSMNTCSVVGVTCNTFHAPVIFDAFKDEINENNMEICSLNNVKYDINANIKLLIPGYLHINHMIELTLKYILNDLNVTSVGLMSTTGTRETNLYSDIAKKDEFNMKIVEVNENEQDELHQSIYDPDDGIKALSIASPRVRNNFEKYVKDLKNKGVEAVILGCTEIPIALPEQELYGVKLVDPMNILAQTLIKQVNDNTL
eukprot:393949_1